MCKELRGLAKHFTVFLLSGLFSFVLCCAPVYAEKQLTVAYIGFSTDKPFWVALGQSVREEATRRDINLIDLTSPEPDAEMQARLLEHAVEKGVDAIILGAYDPSRLLQGLTAADQGNIPVIAIDTAIEHPAVKSLVATDNAGGAALAGEYIVRKTAGKGSVLILGGTENHPNGDARRYGVTQKTEAAGMTVLFRRADWEDEKAYLITSEELGKANDISAIFSCWDPGIDTASQVVTRMGLEKKLVLVGFDGLRRTLGFIEQGKVTATIAQNPKLMGKRSVETLLQILSGEEYADKILIPPFLVDRHNLNQIR